MLNKRLKNCLYFKPSHENILKKDEKSLFYAVIPNSSTILSYCFSPHLWWFINKNVVV